MGANLEREPDWIDRLFQQLAFRSWRMRRRLSFTHRVRTPSGSALVPIVNRTGDLYVRESLAEGWMTQTIRMLHSFKPGTVLDVGANVGQTLLHVKWADPAISYVGCEPLAAEVDCIRKLVQMNDFDAVRVFSVALGGVTSSTRLRVPEDSRMSTVLRSIDYRHFITEVDTLVLRGDDFLRMADVDDVSIIKIDVEGFEAEVVAGFTETLSQRRPFVILEVLPFDTEDEDGAQRAELLQERLAAAGYVFRRIRNSGRLEPTDALGYAFPVESHSSIDFNDANYLAVPVEQSEAFDEYSVRAASHDHARIGAH
jgi:FkbM family methyltransferase